jgi:hypothetical protein
MHCPHKVRNFMGAVHFETPSFYLHNQHLSKFRNAPSQFGIAEVTYRACRLKKDESFVK